jgi:hypothetical protein
VATLTLSRTNTLGTKVLTGASDWEHYQANVSRTRMTGTPGLLSDYTKIGVAFTELGYNDDQRLFSASDPSVSDHDGIYSGGTAAVGNGFSFTVPAGTTSQTLICYFGQFSASSIFRVSMTGGGVTSPQTDSQADPGFNVALPSNFTIVFQAASAGQTLTVSIEIGATFSASYGNVTIAALALSGAAAGATPLVDPAYAEAQRIARAAMLAGDPIAAPRRTFVSMAAAEAQVMRRAALPDQMLPIPPIVSRTVEAVTTTATWRPQPPRFSDRGDVIPPVLTHTGGFDQPPEALRPRPRAPVPSPDPIAPTPAAATPEQTTTLVPVARPTRVPWAFDVVPPVVSRAVEATLTVLSWLPAPRGPSDRGDVVPPLLVHVGGFETMIDPARPRRPPSELPSAPIMALLGGGWAPPQALADAAARRPRAADLVPPLPGIAAAATSSWAPEQANAARAWRVPPPATATDPLPAVVAAAIKAWGYDQISATAILRRLQPAPIEPALGPLLVPGGGFDMVLAAAARRIGIPAAALDVPPALRLPPSGWETAIAETARRAGVPAPTPDVPPVARFPQGGWGEVAIAAAARRVGAPAITLDAPALLRLPPSGWEVAIAERARAAITPLPPVTVVAPAPGAPLVELVEAARRLWRPPAAATSSDPLPPPPAPAVRPWGYDTVEGNSARVRKRVVMDAAVDVLLRVVAAQRPFAFVGTRPTKVRGTLGPTKVRNV